MKKLKKFASYEFLRNATNLVKNNSEKIKEEIDLLNQETSFSDLMFFIEENSVLLKTKKDFSVGRAGKLANQSLKKYLNIKKTCKKFEENEDSSFLFRKSYLNYSHFNEDEYFSNESNNKIFDIMLLKGKILKQNFLFSDFFSCKRQILLNKAFFKNKLLGEIKQASKKIGVVDNEIILKEVGELCDDFIINRRINVQERVTNKFYQAVKIIQINCIKQITKQILLCEFSINKISKNYLNFCSKFERNDEILEKYLSGKFQNHVVQEINNSININNKEKIKSLLKQTNEEILTIFKCFQQDLTKVYERCNLFLFFEFLNLWVKFYFKQFYNSTFGSYKINFYQNYDNKFINVFCAHLTNIERLQDKRLILILNEMFKIKSVSEQVNLKKVEEEIENLKKLNLNKLNNKKVISYYDIEVKNYRSGNGKFIYKYKVEKDKIEKHSWILKKDLYTCLFGGRENLNILEDFIDELTFVLLSEKEFLNEKSTMQTLFKSTVEINRLKNIKKWEKIKKQQKNEEIENDFIHVLPNLLYDNANKCLLLFPKNEYDIMQEGLFKNHCIGTVYANNIIEGRYYFISLFYPNEEEIKDLKQINKMLKNNALEYKDYRFFSEDNKMSTTVGYNIYSQKRYNNDIKISCLDEDKEKYLCLEQYRLTNNHIPPDEIKDYIANEVPKILTALFEKQGRVKNKNWILFK